MARGNQRDKAREANQKKLAGQVSYDGLPLQAPYDTIDLLLEVLII